MDTIEEVLARPKEPEMVTGAQSASSYERYATHVEGYHHKGSGAGRGGADDRRDAG
jgi:hypothetical protein